MHKKEIKSNRHNWFKLDNAGKLYPSIASPRVSTIYRITTVTKDVINPQRLQAALECAAKTYPMFNVRLRKGVFWYFLEEIAQVPKVLKENYFPCTSINMKTSQITPYRVLYYQNQIHLEMSHAMADGHGAMTFLKCILKHYFEPSEGGLQAVDTIPPALMSEYTEDAFQKYYEKGVPGPEKVGKAYHLPFELIPIGEYSVLYGTFQNDDFKRVAKTYQTSQNKMMLCLYFETLQEFVKSEIQAGRLSKKDLKPIILNAPVNLRGLFKSETLRNFFISITPRIDLRLGEYSREEILAYLDHYFALSMNEKFLKRYISRNFKNELFWHVRLIPLAVKNAIMPMIYSYYGESSYTSSISNLGSFEINDAWGDQIERFMVLPPPSEGNIIKAVVMTYRGVSTISFGSLTANKTIEKIFFRKLIEEGVPVSIESNY